MAPMATDDIIADIDSDPAEVNETESLVRRFDDTTHRLALLQSTLVKASEQGDPETLSRALVRLADENSNLGVIAAKLTYHAKLAMKACDAQRHKQKLAYLDRKYSVAKADTQAKIDTEKDLENALDVQVMADEADNLSYRTDSLLKMGQSRLSLIKDEIRR